MKHGGNAANMNNEHAWDILNTAELICSAETVSQTILRLATQITADFQARFPLVITVMNGGMLFAGQLLPHLHFPLSCDYIHASRYRNTTQGGLLDWVAMPSESVAGRHVLLLDDILDEGQTLFGIKNQLRELGAADVRCAVLTDKINGKSKPVVADYVGLELPDRYVFGCGMDIHGAWRNLPAIYAVADAATTSSNKNV